MAGRDEGTGALIEQRNNRASRGLAGTVIRRLQLFTQWWVRLTQPHTQNFGHSHRERRRFPAPGPPFSARRRALHFDRGAVDRTCVIRDGLDQRREKSLPQATSAPAVEPIIDRRMRPVDGRAVLPATAAALDMKDATDDPSIILPPRPRIDLRQQRINRRPRLIAQPELSRHLCAAPYNRKPP